MDTVKIIRGCTLGLLLGISACGGCDEKTEQEETTTRVADTISLRGSDEVYAAWDELYSSEDPAFSIDSFVKNDTTRNELYTTDFSPSDSFYQRFGNLLVYNTDSSMFIDGYSTTWMIEPRNGALYAREGEVDQEVAIVNTKTNKRTRLLFCGPSCQFQKVFWYNDDIVGVMGMMGEYADEYYTPIIWFVNINNGVTIPYTYHSSVSIVNAQDYMRRHMESRGIKMQY